MAHRPPSPHKWTKSNLDELNATFDSYTVIKDFNPPVFIPPEVQERMTPRPSFCSQFPTSCPVIEEIATEFEQINGSKKLTPGFEFDDSQAPILIHFKSFYETLGYLLSSENPQMQPSTEHLYTTPPTQTTLPTSVMETPPPSTNPIEPRYSSTSNATSASGESKDEYCSDSCANDFVRATSYLLANSLKQMAWYKGTHNRLQHKCLPPGYQANFRTRQKMEFELNKVKVTAWSDGGLSLQPNPYSSRLHPVFSIEVYQLRPR